MKMLIICFMLLLFCATVALADDVLKIDRVTIYAQDKQMNSDTLVNGDEVTGIHRNDVVKVNVKLNNLATVALDDVYFLLNLDELDIDQISCAKKTIGSESSKTFTLTFTIPSATDYNSYSIRIKAYGKNSSNLSFVYADNWTIDLEVEEHVFTAEETISSQFDNVTRELKNLAAVFNTTNNELISVRAQYTECSEGKALVVGLKDKYKSDWESCSVANNLTLYNLNNCTSSYATEKETRTTTSANLDTCIEDKNALTTDNNTITIERDKYKKDRISIGIACIIIGAIGYTVIFGRKSTPPTTKKPRDNVW